MPMRIDGRRVVLRDWRAADLAAHREWLRPGHEWQRWDAPYYGPPSPGDADGAVEHLRRDIAAGDWPTPRRRLAIADPSTDGYLGLVSWYWESEPSDWRRVGIVLHDPATWSGGLGTEALTLWTTYLFATTGAHRLDFATWSGNERMCRLGRTLGWTEEARFRDAREVRGERYDSVVYGVLRKEWRGPGASGSRPGPIDTPGSPVPPRLPKAEEQDGRAHDGQPEARGRQQPSQRSASESRGAR